MVRHLTVDEAARILGTTDRTVRRMLNEGRLTGSQALDKGKQVWRVHLTKEILQHMPRVEDSQAYVVDVEEVREQESIQNTTQTTVPFQSTESSQRTAEYQPEQQSTRSSEEQRGEHTKTLAENVWKEIETKFIERLTVQSEEIGRLKSKLEESSGRLLLLEDREKQLEEVPKIKEEAELAKQAFEAKAFELEATKKQLIIAQQEKQSAIQAATDVSIAKEILNREMETLKSRKEAEEAARQEEVATMNAALEELRRPWWTKMFGGNSSGKDSGK